MTTRAPTDPCSQTVSVLRRRAAVVTLGSAVLGAACSGARPPAASGSGRGDDDLPASEDLMREHGLLRRIFGVYDEVARRARAGEGFDPALLTRAARIMRSFGEDYHERAEERWVFPVARRVPGLAATVDTLLLQHQRGRALTDTIMALAASGAVARSEASARLAALCEGFNRMYRPHAAREDTVIFPTLRATLSGRDFHELGERMEEAEHSSVGEGGPERALAQVVEIERALGIDDLAHFTPAAP
jgi:hemerythrin-like domain-containing protein